MRNQSVPLSFIPLGRKLELPGRKSENPNHFPMVGILYRNESDITELALSAEFQEIKLTLSLPLIQSDHVKVPQLEYPYSHKENTRNTRNVQAKLPITQESLNKISRRSESSLSSSESATSLEASYPSPNQANNSRTKSNINAVNPANHNITKAKRNQLMMQESLYEVSRRSESKRESGTTFNSYCPCPNQVVNLITNCKINPTYNNVRRNKLDSPRKTHATKNDYDSIREDFEKNGVDSDFIGTDDYILEMFDSFRSLIYHCSFCKKNREDSSFYMSHTLKDNKGKIICPVLKRYVCPICGSTGENAHTKKYCPLRYNKFVKINEKK